METDTANSGAVFCPSRHAWGPVPFSSPFSPAAARSAPSSSVFLCSSPDFRRNRSVTALQSSSRASLLSLFKACTGRNTFPSTKTSSSSKKNGESPVFISCFRTLSPSMGAFFAVSAISPVQATETGSRTAIPSSVIPAGSSEGVYSTVSRTGFPSETRAVPRMGSFFTAST